MMRTGGVIEAAAQRWQQFQPRERRLIGIGSLVLGLILVYVFAFEPAWNGRQRLTVDLPKLRGQLAQVESLALEAKRLSGTATTGGDTPEQLRAQLEKSIAAAGLSASVAQLSLTGELIDLRFKPVPFADWLGWFDNSLSETRLRAIDVTISREGGPGMVSARLTLEAPRRGP